MQLHGHKTPHTRTYLTPLVALLSTKQRVINWHNRCVLHGCVFGKHHCFLLTGLFLRRSSSLYPLVSIEDHWEILHVENILV